MIEPEGRVGSASPRSSPSIVFSPDVFAQKAGGASRYYVELHRGLRDRGVDSRLIAGIHPNRFVRSAPDVSGVYVGRSFDFRGGARIARAVNRAWDRAARGPDDGRSIYHATWYPRQVPTHVPRVTTVLDMIQELFPTMVADARRTSDRKRAWCRASDRIFVISETTRRDLVEIFGIDPEKVVVTPLGARAVEPRITRDATNTGPFVLFVGDRHSRYKNFDVLLDALSAGDVPADLGLVCFGGGPPSSAELESLSARGLVGRVRFTHGDDADLAGVYLQATALVYPSLYEGFGLPVVEAMQYGCPVICASAGSLPEVGSDAAIYFDPYAADDLAAQLTAVLTDDVLVSSHVDRGRQRARDFTWDRTVELTLRGYQALVGAS